MSSTSSNHITGSHNTTNTGNTTTTSSNHITGSHNTTNTGNTTTNSSNNATHNSHTYYQQFGQHINNFDRDESQARLNRPLRHDEILELIGPQTEKSVFLSLLPPIINQDEHISPVNPNDPKLYWIFQDIDYKDWVSTGSSQVLWIFGPPDRGITEVASHFVGITKGNASGAVFYFFCSMLEKETSVATTFTTSVLHHILNSSGDNQARSIITTFLSTLLHMILKRDQRHFLEEDSSVITVKDILNASLGRELLSALTETVVKIETIPDTPLIIDGIDKLGKEGAQFLEKFCSQAIVSPKFKALLTCRPDPYIKEIVDGMLCIEYDKERQECLNSLHDDTRYDKISKEHKGSLEWLWTHEKYQKWSSSERSSLLYIEGKPGSGKSTLAKYFRENLLEKEPNTSSSIIANYFYTLRGTTLETTHENMLRSVLYSILRQDETFFFHFQSEFRKFRSSNDSKWPYISLQQILLSLAHHPFVKQLYLILETMDESEEDDRSKIIELLCRLCAISQLCIIKVFLTSRPFSQLSHQIEEVENRIDIENYTLVSLDSRSEENNDSDSDMDDNSTVFSKIFSIAGDSSAPTTVESMMLSAWSQITLLFVDNKDICLLFVEAMKEKSQRDVVAHFTELLKRFCSKLEHLATNTIQRGAIRLIRKRAESLANAIIAASIERTTPLRGEMAKQMQMLRHQTPQKTEQLERFLREQQERSAGVPMDVLSDELEESPEHSKSEGSPSETSEPVGQPHIDQMKSFLVAGDAFALLIEEFQQYVKSVNVELEDPTSTAAITKDGEDHVESQALPTEELTVENSKSFRRAYPLLASKPSTAVQVEDRKDHVEYQALPTEELTVENSMSFPGAYPLLVSKPSTAVLAEDGEDHVAYHAQPTEELTVENSKLFPMANQGLISHPSNDSLLSAPNQQILLQAKTGQPIGVGQRSPGGDAGGVVAIKTTSKTTIHFVYSSMLDLGIPTDCGDCVYIDVPSPLAYKFRNKLNNQSTCSAPVSTPSGSPTAPTTNLSSSPNGSGTSRPPSPNMRHRKSQQGNLNNDPNQATGSTSNQMGLLGGNSNEKYIHWCVDSTSTDTKLHHICVESTHSAHCAVSFINELLRSYKEIRGLRYLFSLTTCASVKLIKFGRIIGPNDDNLIFCSTDKITIKMLDQDREYDFARTIPEDLHIQAVEKTLAHQLHCRKLEHCEPQAVKQLIRQIPQKKNKLEKNARYGYGLHAQQGWAFYKFAIALALSQLLPAAFFVYWIIRHPGDLQNAFQPALYMLALLAVGIVVPDIYVK
ncbi:hypothetical protein BDD12DRAFT_881439 [Trichophaea hybrida]|nr:hypothetical protein BDD12DRAFT_881439 [Trichophaea hybrida]